MKIPVITIEEEEAHFEIKQIGQRQAKEQKAWVDKGQKHPELIKFNLPRDQERAYPVGRYTISIDSYRIGKFGNLELNPFELKLERLTEPSDLKKAS